MTTYIRPSINFEVFDYLNGVQERFVETIRNQTEFDLSDKEVLIYKHLLGVLEFYIRKLDNLTINKDKNYDAKKLDGSITIKDNLVTDEAPFQIEFEGFNEEISSPCYNEEGVRSAIAMLKKTYKDKYNLEVFNKSKKLKERKEAKSDDIKTLKEKVQACKDKIKAYELQDETNFNEYEKSVKGKDVNIKLLNNHIKYYNKIMAEKVREIVKGNNNYYGGMNDY